MSDRVTRWRDQAEAASVSVGGRVPVAFILAIIETESSGTPSATRGEAHLADSSIGLMQLLGATAKKLGYSGEIGSPADLSGLYDPQTNIGLGTKLCADLLRQLGNLENVASAYNGDVRPELGFGKRFEGQNPPKVCLERDANKKCVRWHQVEIGEFGNPDYVAKVMAAFRRYESSGAALPIIPADEAVDAVLHGTPPTVDQVPPGAGASGCAIVVLAGAASSLAILHSLLS